MRFGTNVRERRKAKGYTQERFAAELGVTQVAISRFEKGTKLPGILLLKDMAKVLDCTMDELFNDSEV